MNYNYFPTVMANQRKNESNEDIAKRVLTHLLKRWDQNKTQSYPSSTALTAAEHVSLKVCSIVLK